jgi:hypothetical protein
MTANNGFAYTNKSVQIHNEGIGPRVLRSHPESRAVISQRAHRASWMSVISHRCCIARPLPLTPTAVICGTENVAKFRPHCPSVRTLENRGERTRFAIVRSLRV